MSRKEKAHLFQISLNLLLILNKSFPAVIFKLQFSYDMALKFK
jgi:hypothetical protein